MEIVQKVTVTVCDNCLQYYCASTWQLFTILLCQYVTTVYNITVPVRDKFLQYYCASMWQRFTILLCQYVTNFYNITVPVCDNCLQYYCTSTWQLYNRTVPVCDNCLQYYCACTRQLFTILLCQYVATVYNITVPILLFSASAHRKRKALYLTTPRIINRL
jgi:hypothetical protein